MGQQTKILDIKTRMSYFLFLYSNLQRIIKEMGAPHIDQHSGRRCGKDSVELIEWRTIGLEHTADWSEGVSGRTLISLMLIS